MNFQIARVEASAASAAAERAKAHVQESKAPRRTLSSLIVIAFACFV